MPARHPHGRVVGDRARLAASAATGSTRAPTRTAQANGRGETRTGLPRTARAVNLGVVLANGLCSFCQESRAERAVAESQKLLPHEVDVRRDGRAVRLPAEQPVPGDVVELKEGDDVPADCRLVKAAGVRVNNATATGE